MVSLVLHGMLFGIMFSSSTAVAEQATVLRGHDQIATGQRQAVPREEQHRIPGLSRTRRYRHHAATSPDPGNIGSTRYAPAAPTPRHHPERGTLASGHGADGQLDLEGLFGTVSTSAISSLSCFSAWRFRGTARVYRGNVFMAPARHRARGTVIVDRISDTLEHWLDRADRHHARGACSSTWLRPEGSSASRIRSFWASRAGLLAFIPTIGALIGGLIVVLASLASGWVAGFSAFVLFMGVHALESYVLTPIIQRHALDIPPATLFAFQILLGVVFGIWGLALALPLMAIAKVMIDHFKAEKSAPERRPRPGSDRRGKHRLGVLDLGRRGKILPDQPAPFREILRAAEIDGVVLEGLPFDHQAIPLRLLDRAMQFESVKAPWSGRRRREPWRPPLQNPSRSRA